MKIFISWSGTHSLAVATALREWLPLLFQGINLFVSSEDIRKGKRWPAEVSKELESSNFGIVCLTQDNLEAPWLLFEAGALSKSVKEASVYTLLTGGLRSSDVEGPLSHFQHTLFEKEDFFKLAKSINDAQNESKQDEKRLRKLFDMLWHELEAAVSRAVKTDSKPEKKRNSDDMLRELLDLTAHIARNLPQKHQLIPPPPKDPQKPSPKTPPLENPSPDGSQWKAFLELIGKASPFTKTYLLEGSGEFNHEKKRLTVWFTQEFEDHLALVKNARNITLIKTKLTEMGLDGWGVEFESFPF